MRYVLFSIKTKILLKGQLNHKIDLFHKTKLECTKIKLRKYNIFLKGRHFTCFTNFILIAVANYKKSAPTIKKTAIIL